MWDHFIYVLPLQAREVPVQLTPRYHPERQCTACPLSLTAVFIVSQGLPAYCVLHKLFFSVTRMLARLTCQRGSHVYWRRDFIRNVSERPARFH